MFPLALELLPATTVPTGSVLFSEQQPCEGFPILSEGRVKMYKAFPNGRELPLYHIEPGQACIASIACLFGRSTYDARAVAESPVTFKPVPPDRGNGRNTRSVGDGFRQGAAAQAMSAASGGFRRPAATIFEWRGE